MYEDYRDDEHCPKGPGGNTVLINNDEAEILIRTGQLPMGAPVGTQDSEVH